MTTKAPERISGVNNLVIDEQQIRAHTIRPKNVEGMISSKGLQEGISFKDFAFPSATAYHFDVNGFSEGLHAALKDCVAGYVMRLAKNGNIISTLQWNWAKTPVDGAEGWNPDIRMHIASVSKIITGMAMTKLLIDKHISFDAKIINYLPTYWGKGININKITFRQLMTHRSGFSTNSSNSDFEFMKSRVAAGVFTNGQYDYENMNFGLCRILIAVINGNIAANATFSLFVDQDVIWDALSLQAYVHYVQDHLFTPAGVTGPTLGHPTPDALAYTFPVQSKGWNSGDLTSVAGGVGWHMSVNELLKVMDAFRRKGTIISTADALTQLNNGFGIDVIQDTPLGKLYNKNGSWANGNKNTEQSLAYFLPQNMELVVMANSPICTSKKFFRDVVTKLYLSNIKAA